ncbi:MAG: translation elongation factor Ts [Bacteroides sp.]
MAEIKAADVMKLRKMTGAGMMDCKKALEETDGDFSRAQELIRERGKAIANKRADREASQGVAIARANATKTAAAIFVLNCETDFVAKNQDFVKLAERILDEALRADVKDLDGVRSMILDGKTVDELVQNQSGITGEKMGLGFYKRIDAPTVGCYIHPGNRLATVVGVSKSGANQELLFDLAMQIAGMNPVAIDAASLPEDIRKKEFEIGREQARLEGKPEQILDKIAEGRLAKFIKENTLMGQEFIKDPQLTIEQYVSKYDKDLKVVCFERYGLSE